MISKNIKLTVILAIRQKNPALFLNIFKNKEVKKVFSPYLTGVEAVF